MHREKLAFLKILVTVGLLAILPVTLILTNSTKEKQDIRSRASESQLPPPTQIPQSAPLSERIIYIPYIFEQKINGVKFKFPKIPEIRNGFVSSDHYESGLKFTAILYDKDGQILYTKNFSIPQIVAIDNRGKAELKKITADDHGITVPYREDIYSLQITNGENNIHGHPIKSVSLKDLVHINNHIDPSQKNGANITPPPDDPTESGNGASLGPYLNLLSFFSRVVKRAFAANGTFRIAIIGDNYNGNNTLFQKDANDIASGLLSIAPFSANKANIVFYPRLSTAQICSYTASLSCNDTLAFQQASGTPYDKIYVIYNGPYGGYAYVGATLSYGTNATGMTTSVKKALFIHEMAGHSLGGLMDEYSYGTTGISYAPNCSEYPTCPSWSTISGLGCFTNCGYTNLYRATDNQSVMNTALLNGLLNFDQFSTNIVNGKLNSFFSPSPPTPTLPPTIPTPTLAPTVTLTPTMTLTPTITLTPTPTSTPPSTPTLSPTPNITDVSPQPKPKGRVDSTPTLTPSPTTIPTLTPTDTPTPTSSPTPTSTPSPTPTSTPMPTQSIQCSFPNFCAGPEFCEAENVIPLNCDSTAVVCCKMQTPEEDINPQPQENITPTQTQKFEPLPTAPVTSTERLVNLPTQAPYITVPTITYPPYPSITSNQLVVQQQTFLPTNIPQVILPTPTFTILNPNFISPAVSSPKPTLDDKYSVYSPPSPTLYQVENIIPERATPTPQPKFGLWDFLAAPSKYANSIIRNFFSIFSGD